VADAADPAGGGTADTPKVLAATAPASWVAVVAVIAKVDPTELTPSLFWQTLARRGGHIGRKADGPPGWKTLWRGVYDVQLLVEGYECRADRSGSG